MSLVQQRLAKASAADKAVREANLLAIKDHYEKLGESAAELHTKSVVQLQQQIEIDNILAERK